MVLVSIARRYARALFEAAGDGYERVGEELSAVGHAIEKNPEVSTLFANPSTPPRQKRELIEAVVEGAGVSPVVANGLRLLNDRGRILYLGLIARVYADLVDDRAGRVRARLTSASPLPNEVQQRISEALSSATRRKVEMESAVDRALLGGVVAQVGNVLFDGSLRTQIENLRRELKQPAAPKA